MTHSLHPVAIEGFSRAAALYQEARPSYPPTLIEVLQSELALAKHAQLLDLGSGTGKFLPYLKALGIDHHILALDPVAEMLAQLKQVHADVDCIQATSDAMPINDQSIDAICCAQSFHWFANPASLKEIHRILKEDSHLVLVWNQRDIEVNWVKALADLIYPFEGNTPRYHSDAWREVFQDQTLFQLHAEYRFDHVHSGSVEQVVSKRLLSTSFIAAMPSTQQQALKQQFEQIVLDATGKQAQDQIDFPYVTHLYIFRKI